MKPYTPAEDTLLLIDALKKLDKVDRAAEIGCSIGYSTSAVLEKAGEVLATDIDFQALQMARDRLSGDYGRLHLLQGDGLNFVRDGRHFTLVVCNPPYLPDTGLGDPTIEGGPTGVETSISILKQASALLATSGGILLIGSSLGDLNLLRSEAKKLGLSVIELAKVKLFFEDLICFLFRPNYSTAFP